MTSPVQRRPADYYERPCPVCGRDRSAPEYYTKSGWEREVVKAYRPPQREMLVALMLGT